jgi:formyltetrahydrofolate-dependent phosphoribosylglycinamide formyltransferase
MSVKPVSTPIKLAILISGGGTTLRNLSNRIGQGRLHAEITLVISSRPGVEGIQIAQEARVPCEVVSKKAYPDLRDFSDQIFSRCRMAGVDLVVMGGFLAHVLIPHDFQRRVINIHPSLIPAFCGQGYYGLRVHQAALEYGVKISGCTVHFVDDQYDHGPVLMQRQCPILEEDSPESLQARVFQLECETLPEAIQAIAQNRIHWSKDGRIVWVVDRK